MLRETHRDIVVAKFGRKSGTGTRLLDRLFASPLVNAKIVEEQLGVSKATANTLLASRPCKESSPQ
jgi:hypothetical protein